MTAVEVNYTFQKLPTAEQLAGWLDATPPDFRFSFKAPQRITHFQRLRESQATVAEFIAAIAPARKAGKLGPLLFQLPPNFKADPARLASFLALSSFRRKGFQIAFEFRHPSWFDESAYAILRKHNAALCVAETDALVTPDVATANFRHYRLRKEGGYTPRRLNTFATSFTRLAATQDVFAFFKHEDEPTGALNAVAMLKKAAAIGRKAAL